MPINEVFNIASAIILSLGSSSVIVIALSSWLGKVWANRILEKDKLKYRRELESTKIKYERQLENYKQHLEKSKLLFIRLSENQFTLYNNLWATLLKLKQTAEDLWQTTTVDNLMSFALHLDKTFNSIGKNRLIIEDSHYEKLQHVLETFSKFRLGKENLIKLRRMTDEQRKKLNMTNTVNFINENKKTKFDYENLLEDIVKDFKKQIRLVNL